MEIWPGKKTKIGVDRVWRYTHREYVLSHIFSLLTKKLSFKKEGKCGRAETSHEVS